MIEADEIREVKEEKEEKPVINPFSYVTIPVSEYKKLIKKVEKYKHEFRKWELKYYDRGEELRETKKVLEEAKSDLRKALGIQELEKTKLEQLQFEKGVADDAD